MGVQHARSCALLEASVRARLMGGGRRRSPIFEDFSAILGYGMVILIYYYELRLGSMQMSSVLAG